VKSRRPKPVKVQLFLPFQGAIQSGKDENIEPTNVVLFAAANPTFLKSGVVVLPAILHSNLYTHLAFSILNLAFLSRIATPLAAH